MSFDQPIWLVALLLVPLVAWLGARGRLAGRNRQYRIATALRAVAVLLLVIGLAGPRWSASGRTVDVAFIVDGSDSVGLSSRAAMEWIREAATSKQDADRLALALFGRDARLEHSLRNDPQLESIATVVDGSATDLARALRLAQGVLGSEHRRRVVLFTDGRETQGDVLRAAEELAAAGVSVDVVPIASGSQADVLVDEVIAPNRVREGEQFDVIGVLRNTGSQAADVVVVVTRDSEEIHRETVTVPPGQSEVVVPQTASESGTVRYEVRLSSGASTVSANDAARSAVQVAGPPKVLIYEGEAGAGVDLERALTATAIPVDRLSGSSAFPSLDRLLDYEAVITVDVSATVLGQDGMLALDSFVRDAGRGFVAIGGDDSFGMGHYDGTPLEELLPVFARVKDPKKRPNVAEALVVDVSGSMAACHCRPDGFAGGPGMGEEGGVNKTDITKEAVSRAVQALEAQDIVGVLAFNATSEWIVPLQSLPDQAIVDGALAKLRPDGPTDVAQAVRQAIAGLKEADARLRHIVLFTDGFSDNPDLVGAAREAAEAGITLSVVATGEGTGEVLRDMAEAGGGRFYPGRDLFSIPDIIVSEVQFAARPIINEGTFFPVVSGRSNATEGLTSTPPLLGYLATTAKPNATQLLQIGAERDPLLVTWQAGLGRTVAWTSDATARWSSQWLSWEKYQTFWADVVKDTFPAATDPRFGLSATASTDGLRITVDAADIMPSAATGTATVTFPDGSRVEVELQRSSLTAFEAIVPGGQEGIYSVAVRLEAGGADLFRDATTALRSYSPEYAMAVSDGAILERIAELGGGRFNPDPLTAFVAGDLEPGSSSRELWPWFALLALLLLPLDVGLRRLRLERADLGRATSWVKRRVSPKARAEDLGDRSEATSGLFEAKRRAESAVSAAPVPPDSPDAPAPAAAPAPPAPPTPTAPAPPAPPAPAPPPETPGPDSGARGLLDAKRRAREARED